MPRCFDRPEGAEVLPCFENLEQRLLLTTLHGGQFFIYHSSQGDTVRLDLNGSYSDTIEIFAHHQVAGGLTDMPGLVNGSQAVGWGDLPGSPLTSNHIARPAEPYKTMQFKDRKFTEIKSNDPVWLEHGDFWTTDPNAKPEPDQVHKWHQVSRSSRADIYAIVVLSCTVNTSITITNLSGTPFQGNDWATRIDPWGTANVPLLQRSDHPTRTVTAPAGSGGVLVGAIHSPQNNNTPRWVAVPEKKTMTAGLTGLFPGGDVSAGITVSSDTYRVSSQEALGLDVRALAADYLGQVFAVDNTPFVGEVVNSDTTGDLGEDIRAVAVNELGQFHVVDNAPGTIFTAGSEAFVDSTNSIAAGQDGLFYAIDESTRMLMASAADGTITILGGLVDSQETATYTYQTFRGLDFHPVTAELYGIATLVDTKPNEDPNPASTGPFLVTIATAPDAQNQIRVTQVAELTVPDNQGSPQNPWDPNKAPGLTTIVWDPTGTTLYGVTTGNQLVHVEPTTGLYAPVGWPADEFAQAKLTESGINIPAVVGLDFIGNTLYGITNVGGIFYLDDLTDTSTVQVLGSSGVGTSTALTSALGDATRLYTVAYEDGMNRLTAIPIYANLKQVDYGGVASMVDVLWDSAEPTFGFTDVAGLEFRTDGVGDEALYAVARVVDLDPNDATDPPVARQLVRIDVATGETTQLHGLVGPGDLTTLAWDATNDLLYGIDPSNRRLWSFDPNNSWNEANPATLGVSGIVGLEWVDMSGTPLMLGVTATAVYSVDPGTGTCTVLGNTGQFGLTSLAYSATQEGYLWSTVDDGGYRLATIRLSAPLMDSDGRGTVNQRALLFDDTDPLWVYTNVTGMDFSSGDDLYAVAEAISLGTGAVAGNAWLVTISKVDGTVTRLGQLDTPSLTSIAFDDLDTLYGVTAAGGLVTVDADPLSPTVGQTTLIGGLAASGIAGIDFQEGVLYGATPTRLYEIDPFTAGVTAVQDGFLPGGVTSLSSGPNPSAWWEEIFWVAADFDGEYRLVSVYSDQAASSQDLGRVVLAGTLAGQISTAGSIDTIEAGFLWGGVQVGQNLGNVLMRAGGGARPRGTWFTYQATQVPDPYGGYTYLGDSIINADGVINFVDSRGDETLHSAIQALNEDDVDAPTTYIEELEYIVDPDPDVFNYYWLNGELVDYTNDTMDTAQFLNTPTGDVHISGMLSRHEPSSDLPDGDNHRVDWYGIPMLAGQTITITSAIADGFFPFLQHWFGAPGIRGRLYDSDGNWLDSIGWETEEDWGVGSRPGPDGTQKPMAFTAPAAGVYYLAVVIHQNNVSSYYDIDITGLTPAAIGGVNVVGDYFGAINYGTGEAADTEISAHNGGNIGAYVVSNNSYYTSARTFGGGDIGAYQAGEIGPVRSSVLTINTITSEGRIGRVASTVGHNASIVVAGAVPTSGGAPAYDDAFVQNVVAATNLVTPMPGVCGVWATGSIGVIDVGGNVQAITFQANYDEEGLPGRIDLIDVGGDWGSSMGAPLLYRGTNGDIGFVHVDGTIYASYGGWTTPIEEVPYTTQVELNDDSGGKLTITPQLTQLIDPTTGGPVLDQFGQPITFMPTISYALIGVDDEDSPGIGDGGVVANLRINGSATMTSVGPVEISHLDLDYDPADTATRVFTIGGSGAVDIYNVTSTQPIDAIINNTDGSLMAGDITGGLGTIKLQGGDLGVYVSKAGSWLHGPLDAPVSADESVEPQFGWFHGKVNGLNIDGDLPNVSVGGALGDLRVTGTIGNITVNADRRALEPNDWDGVKGLVWAGLRIESVAAGDGLADDGPSNRAKAGILSGGSIGAVTIQGRRRAFNGVVFGELNGSIIGASNTTVDIPLPDGTILQIELDAVGQVTGSDGSACTAIIGGMSLELFKCFIFDAPSPAGGVGHVRFNGKNALLHGSEAVGLYVREFSTDEAAEGMIDCYVSGTAAPADGVAIGRVAAGGYGLDHVVVSGNGRINIIEGLGSDADITNGSLFASTDTINTIRARDFLASFVTATNKVGTFHMSRDVDLVHTGFFPIDTEPGFKTGAIGTLHVGGNLTNSSFRVAGQVGRATIGGDFTDSMLLLPGTAANLKYLEVGGDINQNANNPLGVPGPEYIEIVSAGRIGTIIAHGQINADIATTGVTPQGVETESSDVGLIRTGGGYFGQLDIAGSLGRLESTADLGRNPAALAPGEDTQVFNVQGDLGALKVSSTAGNPSNLYADVNVGGNAGTIDIDGDYFGEVNILGDLARITVGGRFGGDPGEDIGAPLGRNVGSLTVSGTVGKMSFSRKQGEDLAGNIISGGSIRGISLRDGDILGDIVSRFGTVQGVSVTNGSILGSITGASIQKVSVKNGDLRGDVTATNGDVKAITVNGGDLLGNVIANNGRILSLAVSNGNVGSASADYAVSATGGMKTLKVTNGNWLADIDSDGVIDALSIRGNMNDVLVGSEGGIRKLDVTGDVTGSTVHAGAKIDRLNVRGNLTGSTVSAGWDIRTANVGGDMTNSYLLAGWDVGERVASILAGDGAGAFTAIAPVPIGQTPQATALGDVDGDGALDLVIVHDASVSVLLGRGDGTFGMRRVYDVGDTPTAAAVGDLNGDGDADLAVANAGDDNVSILMGNGDGTFQPQTTVDVGLGAGASPQDVAIGDLTGDGLPELVVANTGDHTVTVRINNGDGPFGMQINYDFFDTPQAVAIADLDGQNGDDIVVAEAGAANDVAILLNDGVGIHNLDSNVPVGTNPQDVALGDFDIDGEVDIVVANHDSNNLSVLLNDGFVASPLMFTAAPDVDLPGAQPAAVLLGLVDVDLVLDLVVLDEAGQTVVAAIGIGDGTFNVQPGVDAGSDPRGLALGDLDSDDDLDVVVVNGLGGENPMNNGVAHSGNIKTVSIRGNFDGSVITAGVGPGADGDFATLADNVEAAGYSTINKMTVGGELLNAGSSAVTADSAIDAKFLPLARAAGVNVPDDADFISKVLDGAGTDFGPDEVVRLIENEIPGVGTLTIKLSSGRANFAPDAAPGTDELVLEATTSRSALTILWRGTAPYPNVIHVTGSEDGALSALKVAGDVTLGNIGTVAGEDGLDGPVKKLAAGGVEAGSVWSLPGGVKNVQLVDLDGVAVDAGEIGTWSMKGSFTGGGLTADAVGKLSVRGGATAGVTADLGEMRNFSVTGDFSGQVTTFLGLGGANVRGAFSGDIEVERGDLRTMKVVGDFTGKVNVRTGDVKSVAVSGGDFGLVGGDASFRAGGGIGSFTVARGDLNGLVSTGGDMKSIKVPKGDVTGKIRARGNIQSANFASMTGAIAAAGGDFRTVRIGGDMLQSAVFAGFDPGDAGYDPNRGGESANVQVDAFTVAGYRTVENADRALGGDIRTVLIGGDYEDSTIAAGVDPGADGFCGSLDDVASGTGYLNKVTVRGGIYGTGAPGESFGFYAASATPTVTASHGRDWWGGSAGDGVVNANVYVGSTPAAVGALQIENVKMQARSVVVTFNHAVNMGTINTAGIDPTRPTTFQLIVSGNSTFGDADDVSVSDTVPNTITYEGGNHTVTLTLGGRVTWDSLSLGGNFMLVIDDAVTDVRGSALDGEYTGTFPTGNRRPGGDFQVTMVYGSQLIASVPAYMWHYGCVPTAVGMLVGYYDSMVEFEDLIAGNASSQTLAVSEIIASSGVDLDFDGLPDPGTGHVPDYALYGNQDDRYDFAPIPDLSDPDVVASSGIQPHRDNCIADFMMASRSYVDGGLAGFVHGDTDDPYIEQGIEDFFAWAPGEPDGTPSNRYQADAVHYEGAAMTWDLYVTEVNAGRPVLLGVDTYGYAGEADHEVIGIGYDMATMQYACYDGYSHTVQWFDWEAAGSWSPYSIADGMTVEVTSVP